MKWYQKLKSQPWFHMACALCVAVLLFFVLQHLGTVWKIVKFLWGIITPLVAGVIIAYIIDPLVRLWERTIFKKMKNRNAARNLSITVALIAILVFIAGLMYILIPQLIDSLETLVNNLNSYMANFEKWIKSFGGGILKNAVKDINFSDFGGELVKLLQNILSGENIIETGVSVGSGVVNGVISGVISVILAVYFLIGKNRVVDTTKRFCFFVLKEKRYEPFISFCSNSNKILVRYICCSLLDAMIIGVANAILMLIFGLPYISIISLTVGVTNLVPTFGPIVGGAIGAFLLVMINPWQALIFIIFTVALQFVDAYIIKPKLFSGQLGISPLLILISIIVLGGIFGIIGVLLAIPAAAILQNLFRSLNRKRKEKEKKEAEAKEPAENK